MSELEIRCQDSIPAGNTKPRILRNPAVAAGKNMASRHTDRHGAENPFPFCSLTAGHWPVPNEKTPAPRRSPARIWLALCITVPKLLSRATIQTNETKKESV